MIEENRRLRAAAKELRAVNEVLKRCERLFRPGDRTDPEKVMTFIDKQAFSVDLVLRVLAIAASTYYDWRKARREPSRRAREDAELLRLINAIRGEHQFAAPYGSPASGAHHPRQRPPGRLPTPGREARVHQTTPRVTRPPAKWSLNAPPTTRYRSQHWPDEGDLGGMQRRLGVALTAIDEVDLQLLTKSERETEEGAGGDHVKQRDHPRVGHPQDRSQVGHIDVMKEVVHAQRRTDTDHRQQHQIDRADPVGCCVTSTGQCQQSDHRDGGRPEIGDTTGKTQRQALASVWVERIGGGERRRVIAAT